MHEELAKLCPVCKKLEEPYEVKFISALNQIHAKYECACGCNHHWTDAFSISSREVHREGKV